MELYEEHGEREVVRHVVRHESKVRNGHGSPQLGAVIWADALWGQHDLLTIKDMVS